MAKEQPSPSSYHKKKKKRHPDTPNSALAALMLSHMMGSGQPPMGGGMPPMGGGMPPMGGMNG